MNDFAKSQLMKYGWTEGKGLGKQENGITQALKPKLKFDTAGVGHKDKDWNNWWESAFNEAASNIKVESQNHSVSISVSKETATDDSLKEDLNKAKPSSVSEINYKNFVKTSTLLNGNLIEDDSYVCKKSNIEENIIHIPLTDDELFKICGGRTAHKGARHGLTLNGKLKRVAQQEEDLLNTNSYTNILEKFQNNNNISQDDEYEKINNENTLFMTSTEEVTVPKVSRNVRRKSNRRINDLSHRLHTLCNVSEGDEKNIRAIAKEELKVERNEKNRKRKWKEQKKNLMSYDIKIVDKQEADNKLEDVPPVSQKSEKKLTTKNIQDQVNGRIEKKYIDTSMSAKKKKRKKKKDRDNQCENTNNIRKDKELGGSRTKKLKKSHKNDSDLQHLVKDEDTNTLESKFHIELFCNEIPVKSRESRESSVYVTDSYLKKKVDHLNSRINKKKRAKLRKKEGIKLDKITQSLEAVHFNNEESTVEKNTRNKLDTVVEKITATSITVDKTQHLKKSKKNKKNKKNKKKEISE